MFFDDKINLICFSYAGGSATIYSRWEHSLGDHIALVPYELPGRGRRFNEELLYNIDDITKDIIENIGQHLLTKRYALFGHSMGSWICYHLYCKIKELQMNEPMHIFLSSKEAPHLKKGIKKLSDLPEIKFIEVIKSMGNIPDEVFEVEELKLMYLPVIKADYMVVDNYSPPENVVQMNCATTLFSAKNDFIQHEHIEQWRNYSCLAQEFYILNGDHFYIKEQYKDLIKIINKKLEGNLVTARI